MTVVNVSAGQNLQSAINSAQPGDRIILEANKDYVCEGPCILPVKSGTGFITIESSRYAEIPVREFLSTRPSVEVAQMMPRIKSLYSTEPVFQTAPGAHHYKLLGLDLMPSSGQATRIVEFGSGGADQNTLAKVPHSLAIDKCWIHADPLQDIQRGVALNSASTDITNSWVTECHGRGYDTQAIACWNGPGPYNIDNNYLEGAGENVMFGGSPASIPNLIPTGIRVTRNYVRKPLSWYVSDPSYAGVHWSVKNLFELKNARNVLVDGNIFDGNWTDAQAGRAIVFTPRPSDSGSWAVIEDVQFTNNIIRNTESGILILGADQAPAPTETRLRRIVVKNNLWFASNGTFATVIHKTEDVAIEHNTVFHGGNIISADYEPSVRFIYRDNISRHNDYGIFGSGKGVGNTTIDYYFPGSVITGNVIAKEVNAPSNAESFYPAGNYFPESLFAVGFTDFTGKDYRLSASSPYKGKGANGSDPGCDIDVLNAAMGGVSIPTPVPEPTPIPEPVPEPVPAPEPTPTPAPTTPSPDGTKGITITDSTGGVWTLGSSKQTLRNNVHMGGGTGSIYKYVSSVVYVLGTDAWYKWEGTSWSKFGTTEPGGSPVPDPIPDPTPDPTPEPEPIPEPTPEPPPTCAISGPGSISVAKNGSAVININVSNVSGPVVVTHSGSDGQVQVTPASKTATVSSNILAFQVKVKKQSRVITFNSSCGSVLVRVNVR